MGSVATIEIVLGQVAFVWGLAVAAGEGFTSPQEALFIASPSLASDEQAPHSMPPIPRERSKKEEWLSDKVHRREVHVSDRQIARTITTRARISRVPPGVPPELVQPPAIGARIEPVTTLFNVWTREALPILPGQSVQDPFHRFLRDHYTNQVTEMDAELVDILTTTARHFRAARIDVVSGYRSPKYNLMLRKKGHEVARTSQHVEGNAIDFRIRGVKTPVLLRYVRSLRRGGVGYYPHSQFVHTDTGPIRFWRGS